MELSNEMKHQDDAVDEAAVEAVDLVDSDDTLANRPRAGKDLKAITEISCSKGVVDFMNPNSEQFKQIEHANQLIFGAGRRRRRRSRSPRQGGGQGSLATS